MEEKDNYTAIVVQSIRVLEDFLFLSKGSFEYVARNLRREVKNRFAYLKKYFDYKNQLNEDDIEDDIIAEVNLRNISVLLTQTEKIGDMVPYSMLVSLMSGFEYYIKQLLTVICVEHPQAINSIDIKLDYNDFSLCETKEDIRQYYINLYLEELFRPSLENVFDTIEKKFKICKFKDLRYYKDLLLIAEFRNIIVHNNGNASLIFKSNLRKYGLSTDVDKYFHENKLKISPEILTEFINLMTVSAFEICIEFLDHYLPQNLEKRDEYLYLVNNLCLDFLYTRQKNITVDVFSIILQKKLVPETRNIFIFNQLLAKKVVEKYKIRENDFQKIDWDYCDESHYFAKHVLMGNYNAAMDFCSPDDREKWDIIFQTWPMCKPLLSSDIFKNKYCEIYGSDFSFDIIDWTNTPEDINDALKDAKKAVSRSSILVANENMTEDAEEITI